MAKSGPGDRQSAKARSGGTYANENGEWPGEESWAGRRAGNCKRFCDRDINELEWHAVYTGNRPFKAGAIVGGFVVPAAHQAFGSCTGGWDYFSQSVGIDGFGSSDVLQAGTQVGVYCNQARLIGSTRLGLNGIRLTKRALIFLST
jgi:hypothetical protein